MSALYDTDFFAWTQEQMRLLQQHQYEYLDVEHLIEELDSLGKQQRRELRHRLGILLGHLLQWQYQPQHRSNSWEATIREQRRRLSEHLDDNPSLQSYLPEAFQRAYADAMDLAVRETNLPYSTFPSECRYSLTQVLDSAFFPEGLTSP